MNTRWLKTVAAFVAAGASTAALVKALQKVSARQAAGPLAPEAGTEAIEPPAGGAPEAEVPQGSRDVTVAAPPEGQAPVETPAGPEAEPPARPGGARRRAAATPDHLETTAREAAILHAYDVAPERAEAGQRVSVLSIGDVRVTELKDDAARVVVPLELSHQDPGRVPRKRQATLTVLLRGGPDSWVVADHRWA